MKRLLLLRTSYTFKYAIPFKFGRFLMSINNNFNRRLHNDVLKLNERKTDLVNNLPTKEQLLAIDWLTESLAPKFFKESLRPFFQFCLNDVIFEDKINNYNINGKGNLSIHVAKVRSYFRYMSPFNRCEHKGSIIYDNDDHFTFLYKIHSLESSWKTYMPQFLVQFRPKEKIFEGAMEIYMNKDGRIFKIINRIVTEDDRIYAEKLDKLKKQQASIDELEERKRIEKEIKNIYGN
uniref:Uncharacterized protein n=1 Tax=Parastrongyloides trichosuri TaxID=131310 RepID=A0A0N4ZRU3_PARTI